MSPRTRVSSFPLFLWPTLFISILLYFHRTIDLRVSLFFFKLYPNFQAGEPWKAIYHWGVFPGLFAGLVSLLLLVFQFSPKWQKYRTAAFMTFFTLLLGPLLLINLSLKECWQRPRPIQLQEYGGQASYVPIQKISFKLRNNKQKSFPSGHASMGFFLLVLWRIAVREKKRFWSRIALGLALSLSVALSWARLAQGGHFLSDILLSGYLVWLIILGLEAYYYGTKEPLPSP